MPSFNDTQMLITRAQKALDAEFGVGVAKVAHRNGVDAGNIIIEFFNAASGKMSDEQINWNNTCKLVDHHLKPEHFGKSFKQGRHMYLITGCDWRKPKFSISCIRDDGRQFRFPVSAVVFGLNLV